MNTVGLMPLGKRDRVWPRAGDLEIDRLVFAVVAFDDLSDQCRPFGIAVRIGDADLV